MNKLHLLKDEYYSNLSKSEHARKDIELVDDAKQSVIKHNNVEIETLEKLKSEYMVELEELEQKDVWKTSYKDCIVVVRKGDLTHSRDDSIVNPANQDLNNAGGAAAAISKAAGDEFESECQEYIKQNGSLPTGKAMTTTAGNLMCDKVINAVGPIYRNKVRDDNERNQLRDAVVSILSEFKKENLGSINIPAISTGIFNFPIDKCAGIIGSVVKAEIDKYHDFYKGKKIVICNFDEKTTSKMAQFIPPQFEKSESQEPETVVESGGDESDETEQTQKSQKKYYCMNCDHEIEDKMFEDERYHDFNYSCYSCYKEYYKYDEDLYESHRKQFKKGKMTINYSGSKYLYKLKS